MAQEFPATDRLQAMRAPGHRRAAEGAGFRPSHRPPVWRRWLLPGVIAAGLMASHVPGAESLPAGKEECIMQLTSIAFAEGRAIPGKFTCDGLDVSPLLQWSGAPAGTRSFALICEDPDAPGGMWVHWVIYGLPATAVELPEGVATTESLPNGAKQGVNDFRRAGYGGPCPPPGRAHRYIFRLFALDTVPPLKSRATRSDLLRAMSGHILAEARLMGTYQRAR